MTSYEVVQEDDTDVLFGNPFEGEDLEEGLDDRGAYIFIFFSQEFHISLKFLHSYYIYICVISQIFMYSLINHSHAHYQAIYYAR